MVKNNQPNPNRRPRNGDKKMASASRLLEKMVRSGHHLVDGHLDEVIAFARKVMDDTSVSSRDRMRAAQLLKTTLDKCADIALKEEHGETENKVEVVVTYDGLPRWSKGNEDDGNETD
jgi:hypothetical protein